MAPKSPYRLLIAASIIAVLGYGGLALFFGGPKGQTTTYHVPATADRANAEQALLNAGFDDNQPATTFVPKAVGNEPLAIGAKVSHRVLEANTDINVHVPIAIVATGKRSAARPPLNLALVIDRSGSMTGEKMDVAHRASRQLIDALGPEDQLAIVSYAEDVTTVSPPRYVTKDNRELLRAAVDRITPFGPTNISDALVRGRELVTAVATPQTINRVILLSDGRANRGLTNPAALAGLASDTLEAGTTVTTMGMGLDYDEDVLQALSDSGAGRYYFIDDMSKTAEAFRQELGQLQDSLARGTKLRLTVASGVELVNIEGAPFTRSGSEITVDLGTFAADQRLDLLVEVRRTARQKSTLFDWELTYEDVHTRRAVRRASSATFGIGDDNVAEPEVAIRVQQILTARAFDGAMRLYDNGDRYAAADLIDAQRDKNRTFIDDNDLDLPAFERVDGELEQLSEALRETKRHTTRGKWLSKQSKFRASGMVENQVTF